MADLGSSKSALSSFGSGLSSIGRALRATDPGNAALMRQEMQMEEDRLKEGQQQELASAKLRFETFSKFRDTENYAALPENERAIIDQKTLEAGRILGLDEQAALIRNPEKPDLVPVTETDEFGNSSTVLKRKELGLVTAQKSGEDLKTQREMEQKQKIAASGTEAGASEVFGLDKFGQEDAVTQRRRLKDKERITRQLAKAQEAWDSFKKAPGSGGITGALAENVGGLLGQIPGVGGTLEDGLNLALTGGTAEENTRARTQAITLAADMLSEITGEESGRFTEAERELAFRALRQLKPGASATQISEAYRTFIEVSITSKDRLLDLAGEKPKYDVSNEKGSLDYVNNLIKRGFSREQAVDALKRRIRERSLGD